MSTTWTQVGDRRACDSCGQVVSVPKMPGHTCGAFGKKKTYRCCVPGCFATFRGSIGAHLRQDHPGQSESAAADHMRVFRGRILYASSAARRTPCLCIATDYPTLPTLPWTPALAATVRHFINRGYGEWPGSVSVFWPDYKWAATVARGRMMETARNHTQRTEWNWALRFLRLFASDTRAHGQVEPHPETTEGPCQIVEGRPMRAELIKHYMLDDWQPRAEVDTAFRTANLVYFTDMATPITPGYAYTAFLTYMKHVDGRGYDLVEMMLSAVFRAMFPETTLKRICDGSGELEERPLKKPRPSEDAPEPARDNNNNND